MKPAFTFNDHTNNPYKVHFFYAKVKDCKNPIIQTECLISKSNTNKKIGYGTARNHVNDNFNKKFGRELALHKTLHSMSIFNKQDRINAWNAYWEMCNMSHRVNYTPY